MNRIILYGNRFCSVDTTKREYVGVESDDVSPDDALLDLIYTSDPVSGLPVGDLAIFMNEKANPEVRAFIQDKLLRENPNISRADVSNEVYNKFRTVLTDDDIQYFSRNHGESNEEFADRIKLYLHNEKEKVRTRKEQLKLKKALDDASKKDKD